MRMPAGWNIRVTTFDSEGNPRIVRNFLAYESDKEGAIELVRKRVPVNERELAEAVAEVSGSEFVGPGMRPGDVRRLGKKAAPTRDSDVAAIISQVRSGLSQVRSGMLGLPVRTRLARPSSPSSGFSVWF
jgi:hypothetical protein